MYSEEKIEDLINGIIDKYIEHLEMSHDPQEFIIRTLAILLLKERERNDSYRKLYGTKI